MEDQLLEFYQRLFRVAKRFLDQSKLFTVQELSDHNEPTYDDLARYAEMMSSTMETIAVVGGWNEERITINAQQAALIMKEMALAISAHDQEALTDAADRLERMSFI
ncbi:hypothetical protein BCV35_013575 [Vibrio cyclitrophicus]|uniref:hypothetical protein n=1 Tax=Vibrio cyclitrophicus TaxID=47951 RepID=UPI000C854DB2|nr:hypothetical protein [Vibrio cyclitrophicus]PME53202.1 hypothetical protein BCV35_04235 [Vibrio cyclitrophicus]